MPNYIETLDKVEDNSTKDNLSSGRRLKKILSAENWSQAQLADKINISEPYLSYVVHGKKRMSKKLAKKVVSVFPRWREEWLLCEDDYQTKDEYNFYLQRAKRKAKLEHAESRNYHNDENQFSKTIESLIDIVERLGFQILLEVIDGKSTVIITNCDGEKFILSYEEFMLILQDLTQLIEFRLAQELKRKGRASDNGEHQ